MPDCKNTNPVFDNNAPNSETYKAELAKQIRSRNSKDIFYWIDTNTTENGKDYLLVFAQSGDLCAKMHMQVNEWGRLENVKIVNSKSYSGAGLEDLQYDIVQDSTGTNFIYKSVTDIID
jgi:hypothetical protein